MPYSIMQNPVGDAAPWLARPSLKMLTALPRQRVYISSELIRAENSSMVTLLEINVCLFREWRLAGCDGIPAAV